MDLTRPEALASLALLPLPEPHRHALVWCDRPEDCRRRAAMSTADFEAELSRAFGSGLGRLALASPRHVAPLVRSVRRETFDGHRIMIGNAAQALHPVAGQGLNLGLRDAFELAQALGDAGHGATALREANEEIAVDPAAVRYIGALSPLLIPASNFNVHPFVGYIDEAPAFRPDPTEVAELIQLPLRGILEPSVKAHETWTLRGRQVEVSFYRYQQHVVWGATAMILSEFEALLEGG